MTIIILTCSLVLKRKRDRNMATVHSLTIETETDEDTDEDKDGDTDGESVPFEAKKKW